MMTTAPSSSLSSCSSSSDDQADDVSSLDDIPSAVLTSIIKYLDDPQSIGALECTSSTLQNIIQQTKYWEELYHQRWTINSNNNNNNSPRAHRRRNYKDEYRRRHALDNSVQGCIDVLMVETTERDEVVRSVTAIMSMGRDAMDLCYKTWRMHHRSSSGSGSSSEDVEEEEDGQLRRHTDDNNNHEHRYALNGDFNRKELIALCLLRSVHCSVVFEDIKDLCKGDDDDDHDNLDDTDPGKELEEYVIASSRMFFEVKNGPKDKTSAWIRQQLDDVADAVQARINEASTTTRKQQEQQQQQQQQGSLPTLEEKIDILSTVFFDDLNFTGNTDDYYDFNNSMLHKALKRRTGIPMTLAVLYKCVARRIGVQVDIIGLPGHIVIGVPALNRYVDVFRRGRRLLTVADCERITSSYGYPMQPEYIAPLTPAQVFRRILNNCGNCLAQTFPPNASKRMAIEAMRAVLINPTHDQVEDCRRWFSQILWGSHSSAILQEMSLW